MAVKHSWRHALEFHRGDPILKDWDGENALEALTRRYQADLDGKNANADERSRYCLLHARYIGVNGTLRHLCKDCVEEGRVQA